MNFQISIQLIYKLRHLIDFAQSLAYALGRDIGERYEEWLNQLINMVKGPEAKVMITFLLQPRTSNANAPQANEPLKMWKDARGDQATPSAMVAALKKIGQMTTQIRQKIEREFHIQDMS